MKVEGRSTTFVLLVLLAETNQKRLVQRSFSWLAGDWTRADFSSSSSDSAPFSFAVGNLSFEERPGEQSAFRQIRWARCGRRFQFGRPWATSLKRSFERCIFGRCIGVAAADNGCVNVDAIRRRRRNVASPIGYRSIDVPHQAAASTAVPSSGSRIGPIRLAAAIQWIASRRLRRLICVSRGRNGLPVGRSTGEYPDGSASE
jgi:hypothetical protein